MWRHPLQYCSVTIWYVKGPFKISHQRFGERLITEYRLYKTLFGKLFVSFDKVGFNVDIVLVRNSPVAYNYLYVKPL